MFPHAHCCLIWLPGGDWPASSRMRHASSRMAMHLHLPGAPIMPPSGLTRLSAGTLVLGGSPVRPLPSALSAPQREGLHSAAARVARCVGAGRSQQGPMRSLLMLLQEAVDMMQPAVCISWLNGGRAAAGRLQRWIWSPAATRHSCRRPAGGSEHPRSASPIGTPASNPIVDRMPVKVDRRSVACKKPSERGWAFVLMAEPAVLKAELTCCFPAPIAGSPGSAASPAGG